MFNQDVALDKALPGIQDRKIKQLQNKGFQTIGDLVSFLPKRYEDRSNAIQDFAELGKYVGQKVAIIGKVVNVHANYSKDILSVTIADGNNVQMSVKWFHQNYMLQKISSWKEYLFFGKLDFNPQYGFSINSPSSFSDNIAMASAPMPVYGKIPGMSTDYLQDCIGKALNIGETMTYTDPIPGYIRNALHIDEWWTYLRKAHTPRTMADVHDVERRQTAEILLPFCMGLIERKYEVKNNTDKIIDRHSASSVVRSFLGTLPFSLTEDQKKTLVDMLNTVSSGRILDALVQGDVGCGKTVIAQTMAAVMAAGGYQTAIMVPTTVLAEQHYADFSARFTPLGYKVVLLGTKLKAKERREILADIRSGEANIIVGTHAVISADVEYHSLGLTIVDEEHRFGVEQRKALRAKTMAGAHNISMSATPIPRSLALALYGESTTIYNIHTMPAGRQPVETLVYRSENKVYEAIYRQIQAGRQAYVVCPLISASDAVEGVDSLEETAEKMNAFFAIHPEVKIGCINRRMKQDAIAQTISDFYAGKYHILLSTTIVEVGVNVPNATVMMVKNAERFGLAQLHQLRGRVGRSSYKSYCVLLSEDKDNPRLRAMTQTTDGFEIARIDLEQRGTGNLVGTEQSGFDKAVDAMVRYNDMYTAINEELEKVMQGKLRYEETLRMTDMLRSA